MTIFKKYSELDDQNDCRINLRVTYHSHEIKPKKYKDYRVQNFNI